MKWGMLSRHLFSSLFNVYVIYYFSNAEIDSALCTAFELVSTILFVFMGECFLSEVS